ncbi:MAG: FtsX-like permease family protein [Vicinamibacterales bacterium]
MRFTRVAPNFFSAFEVPVSIGRGLTAADASADAAGTTSGVLVSRGLVSQVFGGANPLGRRIRHVGRSREALADPLREIAAAVDPSVLLLDVSTTDIALRQAQGMMRLIGVSLTLVTVSVVLLSSAGIYSLISFKVTRRRREIGIRAALGADRNRILASIFSRVAAQLGAGAVVGGIAAVGLASILEGDMVRNYRAMLLPLVVLLLTTIGMIAAIGPVRQGLRIQPVEALRDE